MNEMEQVDDDFPEWLFDIVEKRDIGVRAQEPRGGALVLVADTQHLLQEILDATIRERWFTPSIRRQLHKAIDMLIAIRAGGAPRGLADMVIFKVGSLAQLRHAVPSHA